MSNTVKVWGLVALFISLSRACRKSAMVVRGVFPEESAVTVIVLETLIFGIKKCKVAGALWGARLSPLSKGNFRLQCGPASVALRELRTVQEFVEKQRIIDESLGGVVRDEFEKDIWIQTEGLEFRNIGGPAVLALA